MEINVTRDNAMTPYTPAISSAQKTHPDSPVRIFVEDNLVCSVCQRLCQDSISMYIQGF